MQTMQLLKCLLRLNFSKEKSRVQYSILFNFLLTEGAQQCSHCPQYTVQYNIMRLRKYDSRLLHNTHYTVVHTVHRLDTVYLERAKNMIIMFRFLRSLPIAGLAVMELGGGRANG